jgi:hypothetical protein
MTIGSDLVRYMLSQKDKEAEADFILQDRNKLIAIECIIWN